MQPETFKALLDALCSQYPQAFSRDPLQVRPLKRGVLDDIAAEHGEAMRGPLKSVLGQYQHWPSYLFAVAFGKRRRDLLGCKVARVTLAERQLAARELERRGLWSEGHQEKFDRLANTL